MAAELEVQLANKRQQRLAGEAQARNARKQHGRPQDVRAWSAGDVADWMRGDEALCHFAHMFEGVDGKRLVGLKDSDLSAMFFHNVSRVDTFRAKLKLLVN